MVGCRRVWNVCWKQWMRGVEWVWGWVWRWCGVEVGVGVGVLLLQIAGGCWLRDRATMRGVGWKLYVG
jgi:hypothetical protein